AHARGHPARHRGGPGPDLSRPRPRGAQSLRRRPRDSPRARRAPLRSARRASGAEAVPRMSEATAVRLPGMAPTMVRVALALMILVYLALGVFYSRTLITWDDESSFLALGQMALTGQITLFQDEMTGQRMPLPFYVLGASQEIFGRNLWAARLVS